MILFPGFPGFPGLPGFPGFPGFIFLAILAGCATKPATACGCPQPLARNPLVGARNPSRVVTSSPAHRLRQRGFGGYPMKTFEYAKFRYFAIFFVLPLLAGCATAPATVEVKVPVYVPCAKVVPRPAFEFPALPDNASDGEKVLAMARDTLLHFKYEGQLEAVIAGCL